MAAILWLITRFMKTLLVSFILLFSAASLPHAGHHQTHEKLDNNSVYSEINQNYQSKIKTTFENKCAACHSKEALSPWYADIPGLHTFIENDRSEAKTHLEISKGFPFGGHGTPEEDLLAIKETTDEDEMPPFRYTLFHPSSRLTGEEKKTILFWVDESLQKIKSIKTPGKTQ